jgi:hypothetical protein
MAFALVAALLADATQVALGPLGWTFLDELIDVAVMGLTTWALGFHLLLLPTFVVEVIPLVDMLPTWTACVLAVIALRKRAQPPPKVPPPLPEQSARADWPPG